MRSESVVWFTTKFQNKMLRFKKYKELVLNIVHEACCVLSWCLHRRILTQSLDVVKAAGRAGLAEPAGQPVLGPDHRLTAPSPWRAGQFCFPFSKTTPLRRG